MIKEQQTWMKRRKRAILISVCVLALLLVAWIVVSNVTKTFPFDDVDGTRYYIKYRDRAYGLYDEAGEAVPKEEEHGYYRTLAGTLVDVDPETGEYEVIAVVDTEGDEAIAYTTRLLMFESLEKEDIRSIEIWNQNGSYAVERYNIAEEKTDDEADFVVRGAPFAPLDEEKFALVYVLAGYTFASRRLEEPIKDANGLYTEYGLAPETRVDDEGKSYEYTPSYYIITDKQGRSRKVIIGDRLVTGTGYYAQCADDWNSDTMRDTVYVLDSEVGNSLLAPVENIIMPMLTYPLRTNELYDVENFLITQKDPADASKTISKVLFSYVDMSEREGTPMETIPYVFRGAGLENYTASGDRIDACLYKLSQVDFVGVRKLMPTEEDYLEYGLAREVKGEGGKKEIEISPEYVLSFEYDAKDDAGKVTETLHQMVMISKKNEAGNYYAYTTVYNNDRTSPEYLYSYDMIVEVYGYCLDFLEWESFDWVEERFLNNLSITYCQSIILEGPDGYRAEFLLDRTEPMAGGDSNSDNLWVSASDSKGNATQTFSGLQITDKSGIRWVVTESNIRAYDAAGEEKTISTAYYAYNSLDKQVRVISGYIDGAQGSKVEVTADQVIVTSPNGEKTTYLRHATTLFRRFYETVFWSNLEDRYEMSEEAEKALLEDKDALMLTMTVKDTDGKEKVYSFYRLTPRKAYITVNGEGGFYVLAGRVEKILADADRFFAGQDIDPTAKK